VVVGRKLRNDGDLGTWDPIWEDDHVPKFIQERFVTRKFIGKQLLRVHSYSSFLYVFFTIMLCTTFVILLSLEDQEFSEINVV
jgi:hypothetical protein